MTDSKQRTRHKILGELESIRTLLKDQPDNQFEDGGEPEKQYAEISTPATELDDAPLLTEALDSVIGDIESGSQASDLSVDDIPVLQATVDDEEWHQQINGGGDEQDGKDDIVARALKNQKQPEVPSSLFDQPDREETIEDDPTATEEPATTAKPAERQPSLFAGDDAAESAAASDPAVAQNRTDPDRAQAGKASAQTAERPAKSKYQAWRAPSNTTENPFLPKHIRDRLMASRAIQQSTGDAPAAYPAEAANSDDAFVDEIVRRYLPKIETELREKIRAMIRDERRASEKSP